MTKIHSHDITAMIMTVGEDTTQRAVDSVARQSLPPHDIVLDYSPGSFHYKFNANVSRINTEFFVQVDSDMILDKTCFEDLASGFTNGVGVVYGQLRDPMEGRIVGVKMYRRTCFDTFRLQDHISPDSDFINQIARLGWTKVFVVKHTRGPREYWHTVADHQPHYTADYTYSKYLIMGMRDRYWKRIRSLKGRLQRLHRHSHPNALIAVAALVSGVFIEESRDLAGNQRRYAPPDVLVQALDTCRHTAIDHVRIGGMIKNDVGKVFEKFCRLGSELRQKNERCAFRETLKNLGTRQENLAWVGQVGLCRGFLSPHHSHRQLRNDSKMIIDNYSQNTKVL